MSAGRRGPFETRGYRQVTPSAEHAGTCPPDSVEDTVWRVVRAPRAKLLVDASNYYGVLRETLKRARHRVTIIGWDIDSRTPLAADPSDPGDDLPVELGAFLGALAERRPKIEIRLLLWDYALLYALEREPLPRLQLGWTSPPQITLRMDNNLPVGAAHHEKIVVVDDAVAFCGGIDLTIRRWDTPEHPASDLRRVDPSGEPYGPFHDLQLMVDGAAAASLAELADERWCGASGASGAAVQADADPWPRDVEPDIRDVDLAIARTRPAMPGRSAVREVEASICAAIAQAERFVYIENQYLTADVVRKALIGRMRQRPALEVLAVVPADHDGWLEKGTMQAGRARFMTFLRRAGLEDRISLVSPQVGDGAAAASVNVHAKLMVIDDRYLRVGSSNLNNRSMGFDSECDLVLLARDQERRRAIAGIRNRLLIEHTGADASAGEQALGTEASILEAVSRLGGEGRRLVAVEDEPDLADAVPETVATLADPDRPWPETISFDSFRPPRSARQWVKRWPLAAALLTAVALVLAWRYTPLADWTRLDQLIEPMRAVAASPWAPVFTLGLYVVGGLLMFPITVLIAVTAMAFGPWEGVVYALAGSLAGALAGYGLGRLAGGRAPSGWKIRGGRIGRMIRLFADNGIMGVAGLRMLPIAPFTLINLAAGAARIRFLDFLIGSAIGLGPGIVAFNLMGVQLGAVLTSGDSADLGLLALLLVGWFGVSMLLQKLVDRRVGSRSRAAA